MSFDQRQLDQCVRCGLCLTSCPTFHVTRLEQHGPRGRIEGMRMVNDGVFDVLDPDYVASMETCVQCRACEVICPSDVQFGALMERARSDIAKAQHQERSGSRRRRLLRDGLLAAIRRPRLLRAMTLLLAVAQWLRLDRVLPRAMRVSVRLFPGGLRPMPERRDPAANAHVFRGCVMDQWFSRVHRATQRLLLAAGLRVDSTDRSVCCGALHLHAGDEEEALSLARRTIDAYADTDGPIVVDSAGCGAMMKEYGRLLGDDVAHDFAARVRDLSEVVDAGSLGLRAGTESRVVWQAPCHSLNVQRVADSTRDLLAAVEGLTVVEPSDGHLCCGAGGAYSVMEPSFSAAMLEQKAAALEAADGDVVVSSNPGCILQLASAGIRVRHVAEVLADALPDERVESPDG